MNKEKMVMFKSKHNKHSPVATGALVGLALPGKQTSNLSHPQIIIYETL